MWNFDLGISRETRRFQKIAKVQNIYKIFKRHRYLEITFKCFVSSMMSSSWGKLPLKSRLKNSQNYSLEECNTPHNLVISCETNI